MITKFLLSTLPIIFPTTIGVSTIIENNVTYSGPNLKTKNIELNKMISKGYEAEGVYEQSLDFYIDLKNELQITDQEIYTSKFNFLFSNKHWNQSSYAKGWKNPETYIKSISYIDWLDSGSVFEFTNPELMQKDKNYIKSKQRNTITLDFETNIMHVDMKSIITSHYNSWESDNNHGWTRTGITSIEVKYIGW